MAVQSYASEFSKLFKTGNCSVQGKDWTAPRYFDGMENDCYHESGHTVHYNLSGTT